MEKGCKGSFIGQNVQKEVPWLGMAVPDNHSQMGG